MKTSMAGTETRPTANLNMKTNFGDQKGFTLIEVILIIVMVSIFMAAIGLPLLTAVRESDLPEIATTAYFLATERLEELAAVTTGSITSDGAPLAVSGFTGYSRQVTVEGVKCDDPTITDPEDDSGCRKVTVTVYHDRLPANGVSVVALRTAY
jgi:prepilin-type N-terminal cleavage/methylation domain-containing protein